MSEPDNSRPLMREDLTTCSVCSNPATGWADGPGGAAVGCCSDDCRHWIDLARKTQEEFGPPAVHVEPEYRMCPFCQRLMPMRGGSLIRHNDRETPFVPHPYHEGIKVSLDCPGSGCVPRIKDAS